MRDLLSIRRRFGALGIHLLIWASILFIPWVIFRNIPVNTGLPEYFFPVTNVYHIGLFYLNAYFLYPALFTRRSWWLYFPVLASILALSYYGKFYALKLTDRAFELNSFNNRIIFFPAMLFLIAGGIFRFVRDRNRRERLEKEKQAARLLSELKFLRSQISPHFLFNMMTNMVSLARQKSDLLEPSLMKLSDLLRYMLYESDEEEFLVSNEIAYLKSYIELQHLRFGEEADLSVAIDAGDVDYRIEPMLLIPFVENAFKHGIGLATNPYIEVRLEVRARHLRFFVANNYSLVRSSKDKSSGIGLDNVRTRLDLLYPGKYTLEISDDDGVYEVNLNMDLVC